MTNVADRVWDDSVADLGSLCVVSVGGARDRKRSMSASMWIMERDLPLRPKVVTLEGAPLILGGSSPHSTEHTRQKKQTNTERTREFTINALTEQRAGNRFSQKDSRGWK